MLPDLLSSVFSNVWTFSLAVLLLGLSIFIHELGHFLAARRRGAKVERFSIGFGPPIWSRRGRDGVEYRISWFPFGGYVLLPQISDLGGIEGASEVDATKLAPLSYPTKMIVLIAGPLFNVLLALALACVLSAIGIPVYSSYSTTRIGLISPEIELSDGTKVPSPAKLSGLQVGDRIRAIDGHAVKNWNEVRMSLALGDGHTATGERRVVVTVERDNKVIDYFLQPQLTGEEKDRKVGVAPGFELLVAEVSANSLAQTAGFQKGDELLRLDDTLTLLPEVAQSYLDANHARPVVAHVRRHGAEVTLTIPPHPAPKSDDNSGLAFTTGMQITHPSPFELLGDQVKLTFRSLWSLISPHSDVGISKASGVVGILRFFQNAAENGLRAVLIVTILVNINLAIFNLLPIPILDGGEMVFATVARLNGRLMPVNFIVTTKVVCLALLLSLIAYVSFSDIRRWVRDKQAATPAVAPAPAPAKP